MRRLWIAPLLLAALGGCSTKDATKLNEAPVPKYDADAIAKAALADYDKDGNGAIDVSEAKACPALSAAFAAIDTNNDRRISADEIKKRVEAYAAGSTGSVPVAVYVRMDFRPVVGATVTFVPEACMSSVLRTATAKTDEEGHCNQFEIDGKTYRGLAAGWYKIQVTKDGANIAARYNTQTTLGAEVFHDTRRGEAMIELNLVTR